MTSESSTVETHISSLWFTGDRAYKLLKPVELPYLNHSTTALRLAAVDRECALNRRLAPDVYLGTADVVEHGQVVDRMLVMRRLAEHQRLTERLNLPTLPDDLRSIAKTIAAFHAPLPPVVGGDAEMATAASMAKNWEDNLQAIRPSVGGIIDPAEFVTVEALALDYLSAHTGLLDDRIAKGFVRDGHGDLRAEDIFCTPTGPRILDCLAFDDRLRIGDVLLDVAFLAMDLDRLVGKHAARHFVSCYQQFAGEHHPSSLAHHYVAYRAHVRAKIACMLAADGDLDKVAEARSYHALAHQHLRRGEVHLVLVGGGAGTGKSTVATGLADAMGWMRLSSDELRKDLAGVAHSTRLEHEPGEGAYSPANKDRVYEELVREGCKIVQGGESVILDASWNSHQHRQLARDAAARCGVKLTELRCEVDPIVARERIARRMADTNTPSDATPEIADHLRATFDHWPQANVVDTASRMAEVQERVLALVRVW